MSNDSSMSRPDPPEEEYPLEPSEPAPSKATFEGLPPPRSAPTRASEDRQFSLIDLLGLMVLASLLFSLAGFLPGGHTPQNLAGLLGVCVLVGMIVVSLLPHPRPFMDIAVWILFSLYVLLSILAVAIVNLPR